MSTDDELPDDGEAEWLLARSQGRAAAPPRDEAPRQYDALEDLLGDLAPIEPPADWKARVLARADAEDAAIATAPTPGGDAGPATADAAPSIAPGPIAPTPPRRRATFLARRPQVVALAGLAAAAAIAFVLVRRPGAPRPASLRVDATVASGEGTPRGSGAAAIGDRLTALGRLAGPGALRVYRDDRVLVVECPGAPPCRATRDGATTVHSATVTLDAPGTYRVVVFDGAGLPPSVGSFDRDVAALPAAVTYAEARPVAVR